MKQMIIDHYSDLQKMAFKMTLGHESFEDLAQETCIRLITKHDQYKALKDSHFLNFAKTVMTRIFLNILRSRKSKERWKKEYCIYKKMTESTIKIDDSFFIYKSIIDEIENDYEDKVTHMYIEGFTFKEVAEELNLNINTIHGRNRSFRKRIRGLV
jgi:RNA polymerase sigma factor (sigma-70 family)